MNLAERRAQQGKPKRLRTTIDATRIDGKNLLADQKRLSDELIDLQAKQARPEADEQSGPPAKAGAGAREAKERANRIAAIRAELLTIAPKIAEFQDVLTIEGAWTGGEWHLWKEAHPPREDSDIDDSVAKGWCNATDLLATLGTFIVEVNGEPVADGDWDSWLAEDYLYADRCEAVRKVIGLYELQVDRAPKSPSGASRTAPSANN